jgi:uroporphyrin-III C-methyltransferase
MGTVYLVGAGPGDPDLLTRKGANLLRRAGAVVYDALSNPALLEEAPPEAELHDAGRRAGSKRLEQPELNDLLVELAGRHEIVVRLKGGDPFVFGRGGEEWIHLVEAGIPVEVVPGVSSALALPGLAGIPITHRGVASSVTVVTGHAPTGHAPGWDRHATADTVVVLMGVEHRREIAAGLIAAGRPPHDPVAAIEQGSTRAERVTVSDLAGMAAGTLRISAPALLIIGPVVGLRARTMARVEKRAAVA